MKVIAHAGTSALLVEGTNGNLYGVWIKHNMVQPKKEDEIRSVKVTLLEKAGMSEERRIIVEQVFCKNTLDTAQWGQGPVDLVDVYQHMTPEQRKMLYD